MNQSKSSFPKFLTALIILLLLLGIGGLGGGMMMLLEPSGALLKLSPDFLYPLPIPNFILPGLFLTIVMGIFPFIISWGLYKRKPWAWITALLQGITLILWICFQIILWGKPMAIQIIYLIWGIAIVSLCFAPLVRDHLQNQSA
jgi:hypothetical protein